MSQQRQRDVAQELLAKVSKRLEEAPPDAAALALAERIDAMVQKVSAERDRRDHLPRREQELQARRAEAQDVAARLNLTLGEDLNVTLPTEAEVAHLRELASRWTELEARAGGARDAVERAEAEIARADTALADAPLADGIEMLRSAVDAALRGGDLDAIVEEKGAVVGRAEARMIDGLAELAPWTGDASSLARIVTPAAPVIDTAQAELGEVQRKAAEATRAAGERVDQVEAAEARVAALSGSGQAVSAERLAEARAERDFALAAVRDHIAGSARLDDAGAAVERLDEAVRGADEVADHRFAAADASARLAQAETDLAELRLRRDQTAHQAETASANLIARQTGWTDRLAEAGLPAMPPEEFRAWLARRARALELREALADAEADRQSALKSRSRAVARLADALGEPEPAADAAYSPVLARAEAQLTKLAQLAQVFADLKRESRAARGQLEGARAQRDKVERERGAWRSAWEAALAESRLTLAPEAAGTRLGAFETLRGALSAAGDSKHRIDAMHVDARQLADEVAAIGGALGLEVENRDALDLIELARTRLAEARTQETRRETLKAEAEEHRATTDAAQAALDAAEMALADARGLTGAADRIALAEALDASRLRRGIEADIAETEREVGTHGDGRPLAELEAGCEGEIAEGLAERAAILGAEVDKLAERAQEAGERAAEAQLRFEQLDPGSVAADAAADMEHARAEMETQAEFYLLKRTQRLLLDYAMRRQAERRRNPLLTRAAALFRKLTIDRYADLRADYESEKPRLLGVGTDGTTTVAVSDMSEGTQDQLFLALRLAAVEQGLEAGVRAPFLADDLFVNFDDARARAGLLVLGELSRSAQVLFFTHHAHLQALAQDVFGEVLSARDLSGVP